MLWEGLPPWGGGPLISLNAPEAWWGEKPQGGHPGYLAGGASESGQGAGPMGRLRASEKHTEPDHPTW